MQTVPSGCVCTLHCADYAFSRPDVPMWRSGGRLLCWGQRHVPRAKCYGGTGGRNGWGLGEKAEVCECLVKLMQMAPVVCSGSGRLTS